MASWALADHAEAEGSSRARKRRGVIFDPRYPETLRAPQRQTQPLTPSAETMDPSRLAPEAANGEKKQQAIRDAKDMYAHTLRICEKLNIRVPPYDFLELIGKGASGRVYKCRDRKNGDLVAIKIVDSDTMDYGSAYDHRDDTILDFRKEVETLQKLKDGQAQNVNIIHEAIEVGSTLWIVSDYCTGGSVRTLMRALPPENPCLEEQYIIPIARELLVALVSLHALGIIHRDIKCTNVYITETGALQLGDFGVVGVTDDQTNKRMTILGTPHWMPRELVSKMDTRDDEGFEGYSMEIDIWAFGCTVFEMATGLPPNARVNMHELKRVLHQAPRLEGGKHSQGLRDFVAFCLNIDPQQRPTAQELLEHPYVANTQKRYPTTSLVKLIERYKLWEYGGGVRQSLFLAGGAAPIPTPMVDHAVEGEVDDDWNFSTSDNFNDDFVRRYSHVIGADTQAVDFASGLPSAPSFPSGTSRAPPPLDTSGLSNFEKLQVDWSEQSASRGEQSLARLYSLNTEEYKLHTPMQEPEKKNDLPLRSSTQNTEAQESIVDLDEAGDPSAMFNFDFVDSTTLKARKSRRMSSQDDEEAEDDYQYGRTDDGGDKRATMEWTFPSTSKKVSPKRATMDWTFASARPAEPDDPEPKMDLPPPGDGDPPSAFRPTLKHTQTMPLGGAGDYIHQTNSFRPPTSPIRDSMASMIDLDMGMVDDSPEIERPGTAVSASGSHYSDQTSGDPFDLEDDELKVDRDRYSYHKQWQSEGGQVDRPSRLSVPMHTRGSSLSSTDNEIERRSNGLTYHIPPRMAKNGNLAVEDNIDLDSWPNFDQPGIERISSNEGEIVHVRQHSGAESAVSGRLGSRSLAFPRIVGPSADSLAEEASVQQLGAELERLCGDFAESMQATAAAWEQHSGLEEEVASVGGSGSEAE